MNASAFSYAAPTCTPTLADDDINNIALAIFTRAIDKIDGLHRGPGRRKPRRIPQSSRRWDDDETHVPVLNIACNIKPNEEGHSKSSSVTITTNTTTTSITGHNNSSITSFDFSSSTTLPDDMLVDLPSSPTSTSTSPEEESLVDENFHVDNRDEISSPSSFAADINNDDDDDDDGNINHNGGNVNSIHSSDLLPVSSPRNLKRTRDQFCDQLNDVVPPSSPRRRYNSPSHNLRSVFQEIQDGIDYASSDDEEEQANLSPCTLLPVCQGQQDQDALGHIIPNTQGDQHVLTKPSTQQGQCSLSMATETAQVNNNDEDCHCLHGVELQESASSFINAVDDDQEDLDCLLDDESGWAALMSLFMT